MAEAEEEKARGQSLERAVQEANALAAAERAAREAAETATRSAYAQAASERSARQLAEQALHDASVQSATDRAEREIAVKAARDAASSLAAERVAREAAERSARQAFESIEHEAAAKIAAMSATSASTHAPSQAPTQAIQAIQATQATQATQAPASLSQVPPQPVPSSTPPALSAGSPAPGAALAPPPARTSSWLIPVAIVAGAGLLFFLISTSFTTFENTVSVKTDDAYVRADVAPLSTKSTGVVRIAPVEDFQSVKAGQVLVELKNDEYKARVDQAREAVRQAEIKVADMKQRKEQQDARVSQSLSAYENSQTSVAQSLDSVGSAQASIEEAKAGIAAAEAAISGSQASARAAAAELNRSALERTRQEALLANESTTNERVEQVVDENEKAKANLEAAQASEARARAELAERQAQLAKAKQQLLTIQSERQKTVLLVKSHMAERVAQIKARELLDGEEKQLISDLASKKAGLVSAQVDLDYTIVRSPADGIVGELKVKPGQLVGAGTQVITVISNKPWVIANYRETQLTKVKSGDLAKISVDALPGTHLNGHVERVAPASGAQFSLLPPENASGNFTKIVQRIPVKIVFDEDKEKLANLRPGMSLTVTIEPGSKR